MSRRARGSIGTVGTDALIAAITNGRGDPLKMPSLCKLFDFTVSAEDADIYPERKPAAAPFLAALQKFEDAAVIKGVWKQMQQWRSAQLKEIMKTKTENIPLHKPSPIPSSGP